MKEPYLDLVKNKLHKREFTKFRISLHRLEIEQGRYRGIPPDQRICKQCTADAVEDEVHFLISCTKFKQIRSLFLADISEHLPRNFDEMSDDNKFIWLLSSEDTTILNPLAKFVFDSFQLR